VLDELLGQLSHLREQRVRLLAGEVSRRHPRMIERKVAARQRDSAERAVHPTRLSIWLALIALLTFAQVYGRYVADSDTIDDPLYSSSFAASSLTQWILLGGIAFGLAYGARELLALRAPRRVGRAVLIAIATFLLVVITGAVLSALGLNPSSEQGLVPDDWPPPDQAVFAFNVALVVLVGPLVEELLFRGLGFSLLRPFGRMVAIVGSAAAFAAVHGLVEGFALIFLLGLGLAAMRDVTGSVLPGYALHATFNAVAVTAAALSSSTS
jgi:membrane protease YdiL (CAAX protease family)